MSYRLLYVERKPSEFVSIEKAFREIAAALPSDIETEFQQVPYGPRILDTIRNLLFFRKRPADIYHVTGHINYLGLIFSPRNTVLSIMDVGFIHRSKGLRRYVLKKLYLDLPVKRLRYITAISSKVRDEIIVHSNCEPAKIRALDLPLIGHFVETPGRQFNEVRPIILQIGTMENKNIPNLARALNGIRCELRIVGRLSESLIKLLSGYDLDYTNVQDLTDDEVREEYASADIVAYCSTYEGFGLPIIEGQAMRTPVITSNISPLKETAGDGACLVDPFDPESIREGLLRIIQDREFRTDLVEQGIENISRFSSHSVAKQYAALYAEILAVAK
ncbi:MAG: glycosyltransferase [Pyrinomonadaceae bacterium]